MMKFLRLGGLFPSVERGPASPLPPEASRPASSPSDAELEQELALAIGRELELDVLYAELTEGDDLETHLVRALKL